MHEGEPKPETTPFTEGRRMTEWPIGHPNYGQGVVTSGSGWSKDPEFIASIEKDIQEALKKAADTETSARP